MSIPSFEQFINILEELTFSDNAVRASAESNYESLKKLNADYLSLSLLSVIFIIMKNSFDQNYFLTSYYI